MLCSAMTYGNRMPNPEAVADASTGRHAAVDDPSFTVKPGVVTGFIGPNGAG